MQLDIQRRVTRKIPVNPPENKGAPQSQWRKSMAGVNRILPRQSVVSQLNTLMAEGDGDQQRQQYEYRT